MSKEVFEEPNEDEIEVEEEMPPAAGWDPAPPSSLLLDDEVKEAVMPDEPKGQDAYERPPHPSHPITRGIVQIAFLALWAGIIGGMMLLELKLSEYEMLALGGALTKLTEIAWSISRFHFGGTDSE